MKIVKYFVYKTENIDWGISIWCLKVKLGKLFSTSKNWEIAKLQISFIKF